MKTETPNVLDTQHHFDPDNRAYQRFLTFAGEHFDVGQWIRDADQRPVMMTMADLASGDSFTVALMDSLEDTSTHILAALDLDCQITAHGPFGGENAAVNHAPHLVIARGDVAATRSLRLHSPDVTELPAEAWTQMPPELAAAAYPALVDAPAAIAVLIDRHGHLFCAVGPFPANASAADWPLPVDVDPQVAHLVVALFAPQDSV